MAPRKSANKSAKPTLSDGATKLLFAIINAPSGVMHIPHTPEADELVAAEAIEINTGYLDDAGNAAARATDIGKELAPMPEQNTAPAEAATAPAFAIETVGADALPDFGRKRRVAESKYPFDDLPAPQLDANGNVIGAAYFFVAPTEKMPDPAKALGSTVSSANRRYGKVVGQETYMSKGEEKTRDKYEFSRQFKVTPYTKDGVSGAAVWRIK